MLKWQSERTNHSQDFYLKTHRSIRRNGTAHPCDRCISLYCNRPFEGQISYADGPDSANSEARIDIAEVAHSLVQDEQGNWVLDNQDLLNQMDVRDCWTVLLDQNGTVVWSYNTPQDFPTSFTQNEIAVISHDRAYGSSSTFIWTKDPNLVNKWDTPENQISYLGNHPL